MPFAARVNGLGRERIAAIMRTYAPTWCMDLPTAFASSEWLEKLQQETIGATKERMMRERLYAVVRFADS